MRQLLAIVGIAAAASACGVQPQASSTKSLTDGTDYKGTKYYFGWGVNGNGNDEMDNEVKYDVIHTHDIFTKAVGGNYVGSSLIGEDQVNGDAIKQQWKTLQGEMKSNDMYLQYSSGHGYQGGLEAGVTYDDIINGVLGMPAQELVVFTMACYSGGLVDAFDQAKDRWSNFQQQGKTLFVMASSKADEESSTGPGTDPDEPNGPDGSAGSAFGHSLWKALIGYADKAAGGGNGDGYVTLGEIVKYVVADTQQEGSQTPVYTGAYDPNLKISKVPTVAQAHALLGDSKEGRMTLQELINDGVLRQD
jgi:hypothetical protein